MKFTVEIAVLIALLLLSIGVSLLNVGSILPYSSHKQHYKYEGFKEGGTSDRPDDKIPFDLDEAPGVENPKNYEDTSIVTKNKSSSNTINKNNNNLPSQDTENWSSPKPRSGESINSSSSLISSSDPVSTSKKTLSFQDEDSDTQEPLQNKKPNNKKEGMTSMVHPSPVSTNTSLDMYSLERGSSSCTPSPYSNSKGYICMTPEQTKLLNTRGGNQTGGYDLNVVPA